MLFSPCHLLINAVVLKKRDLSNDPNNPLRYIATNVLTAVAFSFMLTTALIQTYWMKRWGARRMMPMTIGAYSTRFGLHTHPESKGIYIVEYLFVVLSPYAFISANYVLLGRLSRYLRAPEHLLINPPRITAVFNVTTFLIQATGGAVTIGSRIFLVGLALQLGPILVSWYVRITSSTVKLQKRFVYRTIELSEGSEGRLDNDGIVLLWFGHAAAIYVPFWP
ncbi:uncharacterized protein BT62DRAFT_979190 [Guyanagaster necrorhizus]|uniref:Uncharacterized protein n=1 Tax=Guyanagaster necrorhizus TaxID=856835 RepID=A0A9P7VZ84_9AGAR|nr:uncharacterized protein BT62DRAFT_979190 [Guyanagaster necrorhizus MCA 3950]KAG7449130.1 hypothetical protein BT62DRAFT_979190 [Guyanagaster necrorhizus MCA 3950]